jgi:glycosyltransferase involved in cell wall biosynthesis
MTDALSILVPAWNEEAGLRKTLEELWAVVSTLGREVEIVVIDDGSTDGTAAVAEAAGARVVRHPVNRGYGASLRTGITQSRHPLIAIADADGTYPVSALVDLVRAMDGADMAVGARTGANVRIPWARRPAKWFLTHLASYLCGHAIPDLNSGLRVFRRELVTRFLGILPDGFSFTTTITIAALTNGYRVHFHPIDYRRRIGTSAIRPLRDSFNFLQLIVRLTVYFRPLNVFLPAALVLFVLGCAKAGLDYHRTGAFGVGSAIVILAAIQIAFLGLLADMIATRTRL